PPPPPPPGTDVAITGITAPARVKQGDTAHVVVTVKNVGGQDVTGNFDVALADGFNGPIVATQTITGLAVGVSVTRTLDWNTARDRKSTRLNSSHVSISYAVFCLKKKTRSRTTYDG